MGSRKNLMIVVPCFGFGGLEQVIINMVKQLDRSKYNLSLCSLWTPVPEMFEKIKALELPCFILDKGEGFNYSLVFKLSRLFRKEKIHLVNSHDVGATLFAAPAARLARIRKVIHVDHSQIKNKKKFLFIYSWILKNQVTFSITVSKDLEELLISAFGVDDERVMTIPNGIDVESFSENQDISYLLDEFELGKDEKVIGSIGRLTEVKGMKYLLEAFKKVLVRVPESRLFIVGEGELRGDLEELAETLQIRGKVVFTGIREDIPALLNLFDLFALPSLWEGQPLTIIEAMAAGKPVVATDVGGSSEILNSGEYGILVPPADSDALARSILKMLEEREFAQKFGNDARKYSIAELSSIPMVRKYETVFDAVLSGNMPVK